MSDALIAAFNDAMSWQDALAAIKNENYAALLLEEVHRSKLNGLPDGEEREQAIGLGVVEIKTLFGDFTTVDEIKRAVQQQIDVEHAKFQIIQTVMNAANTSEMESALGLIATLNDHRQDLIEEWSASSNLDARARASELEAENYTIVLKRLAADLNTEGYLDLLAEKMIGLRDQSGPFSSVETLITALDAADLAVVGDILAEFNAASTWDTALAAINSYAALLLGEAHRDKLEDLPDGQDREQAIGLGLIQTRVLFGDFESIASLKEALEYQVDTEHAKFEFISALDAATTAAEMTAAIKATVGLVNQHRQELIAKLLANGENPDAVDLANALQEAPYTTVLTEIVSHLSDAAYMAELGARMLAARNALDGGQFFGDSTIIPALAAADEILDAMVTAFNEAEVWQEALGAIKDNASVLLDAQHLEKLSELSDNQDRETAIGLGILEIKTLFGNFTSLDAVIGEVRHQIEVEHTKFAALNAINAATEENMVAVLKKHLGDLNEHRQELIEKLSASNDDDARARAEQLSVDPYTTVLAEIVSHFNDAAYMTGLAGIILEAGDFSSTNLLISALRAADVQLDKPVAASTQSVVTSEDTAIVQDIGATDPDSDPLQYSVKDGAGPQKGTVTFANGRFTYTPAENQNGTDTFTIVISDGEHSIEQVVTVTVTPINDVPVAASTGNSASGIEDTAIVGELPAATDADGDDLTYELVEPVAGLTLNPDGTYRYVPAADFNGVVTFQYRAVDESGAKSEVQTFTLTINPVNDTPWDISLSQNDVTENAAAGTEIGKLIVSDPEGGTFTFELVDSAGGRFVIDTATNTLKVADGTKLDYEQAKTHSINIRVKDAVGATFEKTLAIDVADDPDEKLTGTAEADVLVGGFGKDEFRGGAGNDKLAGGFGNDILYGNAGKDIFVFDTTLGTSSTDRKVNFDTIKDFSAKDDSLYLDNAIFKKLGSGTPTNPKQLSKSFFTIGDKSKDKNDYIIYNNKTGVLSYDADGSGKGKAVEFAKLSKKLPMTYKDFFVI